MKLKLLRVDLSSRKWNSEELGVDFIEKFIGGRGLAAKLIWDEIPEGVDPFSSRNKLVIAGGPLSGLPIPSAGKLVIASKSPSTLGYGDGNIGSRASVQLKKAGYDAVIFEGSSGNPVHVHVSNDGAKFLDADELWGKNTFEKEDLLTEKVGEKSGALVIGPGGENLVRYATIMSQKGRAGGRTGMGAIMGSKKLAAVTFQGDGNVRVHDQARLSSLAKEAYQEIKNSEDYDFWTRQGTMLAVRLTNQNSALPTRNFSEGVFESADAIDGYSMEKMKVNRRGCPACNMQCGNIVHDVDGREAELDYENIAMLGPNLGIGDLKSAAALNRLCDEGGIDTISTGSSVGFAMEAAEKDIIDSDICFGSYEDAKKTVQGIIERNGLGDQLAEGVKRTADVWGQGSGDWAMHVKNLEISAYNCHTFPGMALAFGTSPIGAHHKDCWVIAWEIEHGREDYSKEKIQEILSHQRKRGGAFECFTTCRLPWIEVGFDLEWYEEFFEAATGISLTWEDFDEVGDRIYSLIRSIFVREFGEQWNKEMDLPPERWFNEPLSKGEHKGKSLDREKYLDFLEKYYESRGWNNDGIPTEKTLKEQGLDFVLPEIERELHR
ncbi:aldehyde ferredoxin oxidoreductase family protein [Candidatus Bipolaricaulota bacterium]|nr:aldehyde ferredoxin oxidoreductase family protein [Candidatus Bipolaricaulota bacterium]